MSRGEPLPCTTHALDWYRNEIGMVPPPKGGFILLLLLWVGGSISNVPCASFVHFCCVAGRCVASVFLLSRPLLPVMALHLAVASGNVAELQRLLTDPSLRSTVNTPVDGALVLMTAAMAGSAAMVELLLLAGADDRIPSTHGNFLPLHFAAAFGHADAVNSLTLGNASCLNKRDSSGATSVLLAAAGGHKEVVTVLLNLGADVTLADIQGRLPIHVAATKGHLNIIRLMIQEFGIEGVLGFLNREKETVLTTAIKAGHVAIVALILSFTAASQTMYAWSSTAAWHPVHWAAHSGNVALATEVMKAAPMKAAINLKSPHGTTPLFEACASKQVDVVKLFLALGADIALADSEGRLPLHAASRYGCVDIVKALVEKDRAKHTLNVQDHRGQTATHMAACHAEAAPALEYLISIGGSLTLIDNTEHTPLDAAAALGQLPCVQVLFKAMKAVHGAGFVQSTAFVECLQLAIMNDQGEVVVYLYSVGDPKCGKDLLQLTATLGKVPAMKALLQVPALRSLLDTADGYFTPFYKAVFKGHTAMAVFLISQGANVKVRGPNRQMAIHSAAGFGMMEIVQALLKDPANRRALLNVQDNHDATPLLMAAFNGETAMVEYLLSVGADPFIAGHQNQLPIHWAAGKGYVNVVAALLKYDPERRTLNARTARGATPLHNAVSLHRLEMVEYLLQMGASDRIRDAEGLLPIGTAALNNELEPAKILMKYDPKRETVNMRSPVDGTTPLYMASAQGYLDFVRYLLSVGADPRIPDFRGQLTAHVAAKNGFMEVVKLLFQHVPPQAYPADSPMKRAKGMAVISADSSVIQVVNFEDATVTELDTNAPRHELEKTLQKMDEKQQQRQQAGTKSTTNLSAVQETDRATQPMPATVSSPPPPTRTFVRSPMDVVRTLVASESTKHRGDATPLEMATY